MALEDVCGFKLSDFYSPSMASFDNVLSGTEMAMKCSEYFEIPRNCEVNNHNISINMAIININRLFIRLFISEFSSDCSFVFSFVC